MLLVRVEQAGRGQLRWEVAAHGGQVALVVRQRVRVARVRRVRAVRVQRLQPRQRAALRHQRARLLRARQCARAIIRVDTFTEYWDLMAIEISCLKKPSRRGLSRYRFLLFIHS